MGENWKDIKDYEGYYQISDFGRVKSVERTDRNGVHRPERILKQCERGNGYLSVHLSKDMISKWFSVHRLVAEAFIPHCEDTYIVNHIDNDPQNNNVSNLEWTTYKGNMQWSAKQKRMKPNYKNLHKAQEARKTPVIAISSTGEKLFFSSQTEAARVLGINRAHIAAACRKEYGYKTLGGYAFEYADAERREKAKPKKVGRTKEELKKINHDRMLGNTFMSGRHLSNETKRKISEAIGRMVVQLTREGEIIAEYVSVQDAKRATGITHISDVANGNRETAGNFKWKWSSDL